MNCNPLHHSIKEYRVPIQPSHTQPGVINGTNGKTISGGGNKGFVYRPSIHFCNHNFTTLDVKKNSLST